MDKPYSLDLKQLSDDHWKILIHRISKGACTPFLGAGASLPYMPTGAKLAQSLAKEYHYPIPETETDLQQVCQYRAIMLDPSAPKEEVLEHLFNSSTALNIPNFDDEDDPHGVLSSLPLPIYITTNYDDFMYRALQHRGKKPKFEICRWNTELQEESRDRKTPSLYDNSTPSVDEPIVFHLHGHRDNYKSIVLTEDDYLDFIVNVSNDNEQNIIPADIQEALTNTSLLFVGYSLRDWNFRILLRGLLRKKAPTLRRLSIAVQLPKNDISIADYTEKYFKNLADIRIFWGDANEFVIQLGKRWKEYERANK